MTHDEILRHLSSPGKGILATDETPKSIEKWFSAFDLPCTPETRRQYREVLFTSEGLQNYISGVILHEETLEQRTLNHIPLREILQCQGIIIGVKVDRGTVPFPGKAHELITEGLDGLSKRLKDYYSQGARFAKWRAVFRLTPQAPSFSCIEANCESLARYAAFCIENDMVPIIEPEILMEGRHSLQENIQATHRIHHAPFSALYRYHIPLEEMILKTHMLLPGEQGEEGSIEAMAKGSLQCYLKTVPAAVPLITFLSGGQEEKMATKRLQKIVETTLPKPWHLTFSYGRALQKSAFRTWVSNPSNIKQVQSVFLHRVKMNAWASLGRYREEEDL